MAFLGRVELLENYECIPSLNHFHKPALAGQDHASVVGRRKTLLRGSVHGSEEQLNHALKRKKDVWRDDS